MNIRKSFVFMAVAMAVALLRAGIATEDALMEVLWFEQAVTEAKAGWTDANNSITYADSKYTLDADSAVSYTPTAQTGTAVRQVFDLDPEPVSELPEVDAGVQTSFVLTEEGKYMAWGKATSNAESASWIELGAKGTGAIALEIDYATTPATIRYYQGDEQFGATLFSANNATKVTKYDFTGSGTLASLTGTQTDTVAAMIGTVKYHTYADALAAVKEGEKIKVVDADNLPEGYVADADGYLVQETTTYVAQVGDTKYATLQEALTAGGTVTLLADLTVNDWQIVNKAVTLDLGGFKLTGANFPSGHDAVLAVSRGGTLTVKNGTVDGSAILAGIKLTASNALDRIDPSEYTEANKATLIVDGATVIGNQYGICGNGNIGRGNTAVTVNSGLVKAVNTGAEESVGIYNPQAGTVVVAGGTVQGVYYGIYAKSGTVTITGGTVKALAEEAVEPTVYNNGTNGKGYAVVLEKGTASGGYANGLTASVTGGSFESVGAPLLSWTRDAETAPALAGFVTDGKFKGGEMDVALIAVVEGKEASWTTDEEGNLVPAWTVIPVLADADYSIAFDNADGEEMAKSTKVGGTSTFNFASGGDWSGTRNYVDIRGGAAKALVIASNATPYQENVAGTDDFSYMLVAKMKSSTTPLALGGVCNASWGSGNTGLQLVYSQGAVKLVYFKKGTEVKTLASYTDDLIERQFHTYLVTFAKATKTASLYVDGVLQGSAVTTEDIGRTGYQIGGIFGGSNEIAVDGTNCAKAIDVEVDEAALWKSDVSASAKEIADKYAVWPQMRMVYTAAKAEDNWDTLDEYTYTLADGTSVTDVSLEDTIVITSDAVLGVHKSFEGIKLQIGDATHNVTVRFAQAGEVDRQDNTLENATITVAAGSKVELNQAWKNGWKKNATPSLVNTTIEGAGLVEIANGMTLSLTESAITAKLTGSGTTPAFTGMTLDSSWTGTVKVPAKTGTEAQNFDVNAYGVVGSTVELAGIAPGGTNQTTTYPPKTNTTESPKVVLTGDVEFNNGYGGWETTWSELSGTGNFTASKGTSPAQKYAFTKIANYTGAIKAGNNVEIKIGSIVIAEVPATTVTAINFGADCVLDNIKIDGMTVVLADGTDVTDLVTVEKTAAGITVIQKAAIEPIDPTQPTADYASAEAAQAVAAAVNENKATYIAKPFETMTDIQRDFYLGFVEATVVGNKIVVDFTEEGAETMLLSANAMVLNAEICDTDSDTATINAVPGFFYALVGGTELDAITTVGEAVQATDRTVTLPKPNLGNTTKAFYKVKVMIQRPIVQSEN